jgi:formyltetrahydrofolate deformylase
MDKHILLISCTDEKGLIAKISTVVSAHGLNIIIMREFVEEESNRFFMRMELSGELDKDVLFEELAQKIPADAEVVINPKQKKDIVLYVTKEYHCLSDLLTRHHFEELQANILAVVGNHEVLKPFVEKFGIPFHYVSHEGKSKSDFESELLNVTAHYLPDYIVLAKFMRILSPDFVRHYENKIVNIHHSFLPAFIGANPYKQAYERGVKLIGATSHVVNNNLDEGPILTQKVTPVDHTFNAKSMVQAGHEVEKAVLAEALKLVFEDRVFVSGNKTIVFS